MTGSLQIKKIKSNNKEMYYVVLNYKDPNSLKNKTKWISTKLEVKNNKRAAEKLCAQYIKTYQYLEKQNSVEFNMDITVADYISSWLEQKKKDDIENSTWEGYCIHAKHIISYFREKGTKLRELSAKDISEYYDYQKTYGKVNQRTKERSGLAVRTVRSHKNLLYAALNKAIVDQIIETNPAATIRISGKKDKDYRKPEVFLLASEANKLISFVKDNNPRLFPIIVLCLYYGFRRSELLGLKWDVIDFQRKKITIKRSVVKVLTTEEKDRTKTSSSQRELDLLPNTIPLLKKLKEEQEKNKIFYGDTYQDTRGYIFTWEDGRPYSPDYITKSFKKSTKAFGHPEITLHKLRHSCASILYDMGWSVKDIQHWLGHADYYTTMNIYTHIEKSRRFKGTDSLNNALKIL